MHILSYSGLVALCCRNFKTYTTENPKPGPAFKTMLRPFMSFKGRSNTFWRLRNHYGHFSVLFGRFRIFLVDNFGTVNLVDACRRISVNRFILAEQYIRKSGINFTIVRPGGLRNDPPSGSIVMEPEDTLFEGSISRDQVAEVAVEALLYPESSYKVVEIVSRADAPKRSLQQLFGSIKKA